MHNCLSPLSGNIRRWPKRLCWISLEVSSLVYVITVCSLVKVLSSVTLTVGSAVARHKSAIESVYLLTYILAFTVVVASITINIIANISVIALVVIVDAAIIIA